MADGVRAGRGVFLFAGYYLFLRPRSHITHVFPLIGEPSLALRTMLQIADSLHPSPGDWLEAWGILEGIPEPGTPGEAAASAALPSKAGGLGRRRAQDREPAPMLGG